MFNTATDTTTFLRSIVTTTFSTSIVTQMGITDAMSNPNTG